MTRVTRISAGNSFLINDFGGVRGRSIAATPSATPILNRFVPKALPIASSGLSSSAETADENISGAEVPNATIVRPIKSGETPALRASADAPKTNLSAPQIRPTKPRAITTELTSIEWDSCAKG